jgi:hypothetical protein
MPLPANIVHAENPTTSSLPESQEWLQVAAPAPAPALNATTSATRRLDESSSLATSGQPADTGTFTRLGRLLHLSCLPDFLELHLRDSLELLPCKSCVPRSYILKDAVTPRGQAVHCVNNYEDKYFSKRCLYFITLVLKKNACV